MVRILDDRPLMSVLLGLSSQGTLRALSQTCRRRAEDVFAIAPGASRTLASLTSWPFALRGGSERQRSLEQDSLARRARLLESLRMMCQDPQVTENPEAAEANARQPAVHELPLEEAGVEWYRHEAFQDRGITDEELMQALCRGAPGDVKRLILCSSKLTDTAVRSALEPHWSSLTELCICNCGLSGGLLTGALFTQLVQVCCTRLRTLISIDIPNVPMTAVAACSDLQTLMLRGSLSAPSVEALSRCKGLQTLRLSLEGKVQQDSFIRVFTECKKLKTVDIHGATDVSDQLLACLMLNVPGLEDFCGSHAGNHLSCSHVLTGQMTEAFKAHFTSAKRIFIDNLVCDSLL